MAVDGRGLRGGEKAGRKVWHEERGEGRIKVPPEKPQTGSPAAAGGSTGTKGSSRTTEDNMGLLFDPREVFQIAVRIEENGERFYREMAEKIDDADVRRLFTFLAEEEVAHRRFYEGLIAEAEPFEPEESYPGEYFDHLRSYAEGIIFSQEKFEEKMKEIEDPSAALDFAIGVEWDSIHYYQELKGLVPESRRGQLDAIVAEERRHFVKLSRLRRERQA